MTASPPGAPPRVKRRPPARSRRATTDRRGELVRAAFDVIAAKGLEGLRTREVADQIGINIATLHYHFATKEALLAGVVEYVMQLFKSLHAPLPEGATPLDELRHLIAGQSHKRRAESKVDVVMQELMLRCRRDQLVQQAFASLLHTWRAVVEDIVARCAAANQLRDDLEPRAVAAVVTSFLIGANVQLGITPATFSVAESARQILALLAPPAPRRTKPRRSRG